MQWIVQFLPWIQTGLAAILVVLILLQRSEAGLGTAFGDSGNAITYTRRGAEKVIFRATIAMAILFVAAGVLILALK